MAEGKRVGHPGEVKNRAGFILYAVNCVVDIGNATGTMDIRLWLDSLFVTADVCDGE